jgi:hypothetical protein
MRLKVVDKSNLRIIKTSIVTNRLNSRHVDSIQLI